MLFAFDKPAERIRRLDGSSISFAEADAAARRALEAAHVTGAQIAVLDRGRRVWSAVYGLRRTEPALPMQSDTNIWAASLTKSVFATYVMRLVERREFSLDRPIAEQLPRPLDQYEPYRETAALLVQDARWPRVTPRHLLSHSSGLRNFAFLEPDKKMHLHFAPGTQYSYSGDGLNIVQFVIEQKLGRPLDQLMQEALFTPLGMTRTGMVYRAEFAENVADRYNAEGRFLAQTRRAPARASGNMATTLEDFTRFLEALLQNKILRPATLAQMISPVIPIRTQHQFALAPDEPAGAEAAQVGLAYGLGWGLLTKTPFGPAFFKEGHGDGAQNYVICFTRRQACMVILTNSDNGELAFRPLLETILGDTVTPWEWEGYTRAYIEASRRQQQ